MNQIVNRRYYISLSILAVILFAGCAPKNEQSSMSNAQTQAPEKVELTVSAAASLTDALREVQTAYESKNKQIKLNFNFGASGVLQQQIEQGAPTDLFFSAAAKNMKTLIDKQLIDSSEQKNLLMNELVIVVPSDSKAVLHQINDLAGPDIKHLAVGEPQTVPAGSYAKEALTNVKLWDPLQGKIVQGKDVRQVLTYVESSNAEAGFVYKTDALTSKKVKVALSVDTQSYTPIAYPAGIVKASKHKKETSDFFTFLESKEAQAIFMKYGFTIPK
ncbi:molybdate transport system substrate-binding protein [Paenibacillus sp. yr247]|uniref:molybdate ABC transporter substrate-binding protein n=1 Tax=Paenibacillus sp. yr247 TaxID=1761880 RepID=UPI0008886A07|nr:molybdate ABC transporter substrate-binding protein [Paenibacillus sp. yr247]SDO42199.1 molybdate transport system substrate-binding protein [Paenibacillus sp. yr247]